MKELEDLFIDDVLARNEPKVKKKNAKRKGNRVELELCKLLSEHFGEEFSRSVGSGNRWSQVSMMPEHAKKTLTGDICVPEGFKWVVECKGGYDDDVDFSSVLDGGCARIDDFIEQSENDARQSGRKPIIMWKRSRKPWIAMLEIGWDELWETDRFPHCMFYGDWSIVSLEQLLEKTTEEFWFEKLEE